MIAFQFAFLSQFVCVPVCVGGVGIFSSRGNGPPRQDFDVLEADDASLLGTPSIPFEDQAGDAFLPQAGTHDIDEDGGAFLEQV